MRLLLIRHGEIDFNRQARYCGITDAPLNKHGIAQARDLRSFFSKEKVDAVYCSPLTRTKQTARILFGRRRITLEPALKEINFGKMECMSVKEVKEKHPVFYRTWLTNLNTAKAPGGESVNQCRKRVWKFINSLIRNRKNAHKTIALVMHGGPIKIWISDIMKCGKDGFWMFHPEPASVTTVEYDKGRFCLLGRNFYYAKNYPGFGWRP
ncbi:MAG: histidine phosphatase family protein [Planctomycetes bacterium]|nr:histidine phosphatase family protein [Planctomycetota bacterium]